MPKSKIKKKVGLGISSGQKHSKTWWESPPFKEWLGGIRGRKVQRFVKSKVYPANYVLNEVTGLMEKPEE